tara:strand:- start:2283 stop:2495 length:213 start_codon:yes stop_codon:yes gene_type:complete
MFEAIVLFCAIGVTDLNQCVTAEDTRGPYQTREECHSRVQEMVTGIAYMIPVPLNFHFKCEIPEAKGMKL